MEPLVEYEICVHVVLNKLWSIYHGLFTLHLLDIITNYSVILLHQNIMMCFGNT